MDWMEMSLRDFQSALASSSPTPGGGTASAIALGQAAALTCMVADLTIGKRPFVDTYKSDVRYDKKKDLIRVTNIGGPLKYLENNWKFIQKENYTEVNFDVDFEIKNKFLNMIMTKSFEFGLNKIADAFQKKAESL